MHMDSDDRDRLIRIDENMKFVKERVADHARDIEELKTWKNWTAGAIAVLGAIFGVYAEKH